MIALLAAALLAAQLGAEPLSTARIKAVTPPCRVQRAEAPSWEPLERSVSDRWSLFPNDHVVCTGRGSVVVNANARTRTYRDFFASAPAIGRLSGRRGFFAPLGLLGLGLSPQGLKNLGSLRAADYPVHLHGLAQGTQRSLSLDERALAALGRTSSPNASANAKWLTQLSANENKLGANVPTIVNSEGGAAVAEGSSVVRDMSKGEAGFAIFVIGSLIWLFLAKQWLWFAGAIAASIVVVVVNRRN